MVIRKLGNRFHIDEKGQIVKNATGEIIPEEEPVFLFRARDIYATAKLLELRDFYAKQGCTDYILQLMDESIGDFKRFAIEHPERMKQPGITRGKTYEEWLKEQSPEENNNYKAD